MNRCLPTLTTSRTGVLMFAMTAAAVAGLVFLPTTSAIVLAQEAVETTSETGLQPVEFTPGAEGIQPISAPIGQSAFEPISADIQNLSEITGTSIELTAIPPRLGDDGSLAGDPGSTIQAQVRVRNNSGETITVDTLVEDFIIGEDGRTPIAVQEQPNSLWSLASWVQLGSTRNTVGPFGSAIIPVVIQVPDNALPGGRYAMIMHQPAVEGSEEVTGEVAGAAAVNQRVGTLVYFRVNGDIKENATIRNIRVPFLTELGPVPIQFDIENTSDIHIHPSVKITIRNLFGETKETIDVSSQNVFPYTTRTFETQWDRVWGFGRYTAMIDAAYGEQGKIAQAAVSFWLIPYKLILVILLVIVALIGIIVAIRRYLKHHNSVEEQHVMLLEDRIKQLEQELQRK
jgi:hypothetical protein